MIVTLPPEVRELYPFEPHWANVGGFTLHYLDEADLAVAIAALAGARPAAVRPSPRDGSFRR